MALIFMEGFDHREPLGRTVTYTGGTIAYVAGRVGGYAVQPSSFSGTGILVPLPAYGAGALWGSLAFKRIAGSNANAAITLMQFENASSTSQGRVRLETSGQVSIINQANTAVATSSATVSPTGWNRIDARFERGDATTMEVYLNGNLIVSATSDFNSFESAPVTAMRVDLANQSNGIAVDDVYIVDSSGPAPYNTRLPDLRIETITPAGNGSANQLLGSDGNNVDNYQLVDEMPTSTTDYVVSATPGERDLYTFSDLATPSGQVWGVQVHVNANKTDAGSASLAPITKVAGVERKQTAVGLSTSPNWISGTIQTVDPSDAAWTVAKVNAAEFGIEVG